jgi:adenosine deaminase
MTANCVSARERLKPSRIAHGVRAAENRALLEKLARDRIPCDVCPSAEVALGVFPEPAGLPLKEMLRAGVIVTPGADDPLLFGSTVAEEYVLCHRHLGMSDRDLASIEAAELPHAPKQRYMMDIERWLLT